MAIPKHLLEAAITVANAHGLNLDDVRERTRSRSIVAIRREVAVALRAAGASYPECGKILRRDHATVMNLVKGKAWKASLGMTNNVRPRKAG